MHKSKFRLSKKAIAWCGAIFFFEIFFLPALFAAENTPTIESLLKSCENSAAAIQASNQEILQSFDQLSADVDEIRIRVRRAHHPRHP